MNGVTANLEYLAYKHISKLNERLKQKVGSTI